MAVYGQNYGMGYGGRLDRVAESEQAQAQEAAQAEAQGQLQPQPSEAGGFDQIISSLMQQLMQPKAVEVDEMQRQSGGSELQQLTDELAGMDGPQFWELGE